MTGHAPRWAHRHASRVSVTLIAVVAAAVAVTSVEDAVPIWVWLALGLLAGLPHGAVDHLVPGWRSARRRPSRVAVAYAAVVLVALLAFLALPVVGLVAFLVLSVLHFGAGEVRFADERDGDRRVGGEVARTLAYGGLVVAVPIALGRTELAALADGLPGTAWLTHPALTPALLGATAAAIAAAVPALVERSRYADLAELTLLAALAVIAPPAITVAVYFGGWHAVRHTARLLATDPRNHADLGRRRIGPPLRRFAVAAALPTAASLAGIGVLGWLLAAGPGRDLPWVMGAAIAVIAALTVPHALVVAFVVDADPVAKSVDDDVRPAPAGTLAAVPPSRGIHG